MPNFAYKGRNARGELVQGVVEGADSRAVADQLFNTGITPIDILDSKESVKVLPDGVISRLFADPVGLVELLWFSRQMYTLLKSGVPILRALAGLQESSQNKTFSALLQDVRDSLDAGRELSTAMRRHPKIFTPFYINMIRVGEATGLLEEVFLRLYHYLEFDKLMHDRIKEATRYPTFVIIAMAIAIIIVNIWVIPTFTSVYANLKGQLPLMTRILIGFSQFTVKYWPILLALLIFSWIAFKMYVGTPDGKYLWDKLKLKIPIAGSIILKATLARFTRSFAMAYKSGVPIVQGLTAVAQVTDNSFIAHRIEQMRDGVERGESMLRTAVTTGVFTPVVLQMIAVGEETGELDDMLQEVAEMYERDVDYEVKNLSARIEPILILSLGAMVLVLALGIFLPMWDLSKTMIK